MKDFSYERHGSDLINSRLCVIENRTQKNRSIENLKKLHSCIDLTSLSNADNENSIADFVMGVNTFKENNPDIPNVAGICVYPKFVPVVRKILAVPEVKIVSVAGAFPHAQTFEEIKIREVELAVEAGADEIDVVINAGEIIDEEHSKALASLKDMKKACGNAHLKVILETGAYPYDADIYDASIIAMKAGADFIKTSTGKIALNATPESFLIMLDAIADFYKQNEKMVGMKPAGGISEAEISLIYVKILENVLGEKWLNKQYFRIGASRLAKKIIEKL